MSFDPNTIVMAATGRSLDRAFQRVDYESYRAGQAWVRSLTQGSTMQRRTVLSLAKLMPPREDFNQLSFDDRLATLPNAMTGYWRMLFRTMRSGSGPVWRGLLVRLAWRDRQLHALERLGAEEQRTLRAQLFSASLRYWATTDLFGGSFRPMLVLDATLQHLAWADSQLNRFQGTVRSMGSLVGLVLPGRAPMRHWFDQVLRLTGRRDLADLCDLLAERADRSGTRIFTHVELKQWATSQKLIPPDPAGQLLAACSPEVDVEQARLQLWTARLLTFLVSFVQGFAAEPVAQAVAQDAIYRRLSILGEGLRTADTRAPAQSSASIASP